MSNKSSICCALALHRRGDSPSRPRLRSRRTGIDLMCSVGQAFLPVHLTAPPSAPFIDSCPCPSPKPQASSPAPQVRAFSLQPSACSLLSASFGLRTSDFGLVSGSCLCSGLQSLVSSLDSASPLLKPVAFALWFSSVPSAFSLQPSAWSDAFPPVSSLQSPVLAPEGP